MPDEITLDEYRRLTGGRARPRTPPPPRLALPPAERAEPDAGERAQEPYRAAGWLFAQETSGLLHYAYHCEKGWRVGPAGTRARLLAMIEELKGAGQ